MTAAALPVTPTKQPKPVYVYVTSMHRYIDCADRESAKALILLDVLNTRRRAAFVENKKRRRYKRKPNGQFDTVDGKKLTTAENIAKGQKNIQNCLKTKSTIYKAMQWKGKEVAFIYGFPGTKEIDYRDGFGISHIAAKHPDAVHHIPEILARGEELHREKTADAGRICVNYFGNEVYLDRIYKDKNGNKEKILWVVTGFQRIERSRWT